MNDPLSSSRQKLARAEKHFVDLKMEISEFSQQNPYEQVAEPHPDKPGFTIEKVRMTKEIPATIADLTADIAISLRSALDNAGYAIAVASGVNNPKHCAFPFAGSAAQMANALGRSKDIPEKIQSLFCGFQPYKGGNDLLWVLNEVANTDKHKMVIPIGHGLARYGASVRGTGFFSMPDPHVWDRAKNEMKLIELGPGATHRYDFGFQFFIAFHDIEFIDGQSVVKVLMQFGNIAERLLLGMETECRRLKIFK
jgi:hypothetical protein